MLHVTQPGHILTIEKPIERIFLHRQSIINQREVGSDTQSVSAALAHAVRADADVVMIGMINDQVTFEAALALAETGRLVLAGMNTNSAHETLSRIINMFPESRHKEIASRLSHILEGIISQQLLPHCTESRQVPAVEVLISTPAIKAVLSEGKIHQIYSLLQGGERLGLQTMNQSLWDLVVKNQVTKEEALAHSSDRKELEDMLKKINASNS
jgi:twitching motility protein PilT